MLNFISSYFDDTCCRLPSRESNRLPVLTGCDKNLVFKCKTILSAVSGNILQPDKNNLRTTKN